MLLRMCVTHVNRFMDTKNQRYDCFSRETSKTCFICFSCIYYNLNIIPDVCCHGKLLIIIEKNRCNNTVNAPNLK